MEYLGSFLTVFSWVAGALAGLIVSPVAAMLILFLSLIGIIVVLALISIVLFLIGWGIFSLVGWFNKPDIPKEYL